MRNAHGNADPRVPLATVTRLQCTRCGQHVSRKRIEHVLPQASYLLFLGGR